MLQRKLYICSDNRLCVLKESSPRFGDIREGGLAAGEGIVGEFSLSSLKLRLFLFSDSAPVGKREKTRMQSNEI